MTKIIDVCVVRYTIIEIDREIYHRYSPDNWMQDFGDKLVNVYDID